MPGGIERSTRIHLDLHLVVATALRSNRQMCYCMLVFAGCCRRGVKQKVSYHTMIRHEVILRIKLGVSREIIDETLREANRLLVSIPGVERLRYGVNNAPSYRHALIVVDLTDEDALQRFGRHPQHARAVRLVSRLAESTAVGSYLVGSEKRRG